MYVSGVCADGDKPRTPEEQKRLDNLQAESSLVSRNPGIRVLATSMWAKSAMGVAARVVTDPASLLGPVPAINAQELQESQVKADSEHAQDGPKVLVTPETGSKAPVSQTTVRADGSNARKILRLIEADGVADRRSSELLLAQGIE